MTYCMQILGEGLKKKKVIAKWILGRVLANRDATEESFSLIVTTIFFSQWKLTFPYLSCFVHLFKSNRIMTKF